MGNHTPGPWETKTNNPKNNFSWLIYNRDYSNWPIAVEVKKEDAHLIAAAPDMYEALKIAGKFIELNKWLLSDGSIPEIIEKALAKAEGRPANG